VEKNPLAKNTNYFLKKGKNFKNFELSPQLGLKNICTIFFFMREKN